MAHPVFGGHGTGRPTVNPNSARLPLGEPRVDSLRSAGVAAVPLPVSRVIRDSPPLQILDHIVRWIVVQMAANVSFRAWSDEREQHCVMHAQLSTITGDHVQVAALADHWR